MIISKTNINIINKTFIEINKKYDYNLFISKLQNIVYNIYVDYFRITNKYEQLKLYKAKYKLDILYLDKLKKGARINITNKFIKYACIHVYYDFINLLLDNDRKAVIQLYEDWIIKKNLGGTIIGNKFKNDKYSMHKINIESFMCKCKG